VPEWGLGPEANDPAVAADVRTYVSPGRPAPMMVGIPFPGTFVLDPQGRVTSRFFEDYYVERHTMSSVMLALGAGAPPVAATKISTPHLDLVAFPSDAAIAAGNRFSLIFDITPRPGLHLYAPGASGYRVISVSIAPERFVRIRPLQYPPSEIYFFEPLNERVPVFQKPFRLTQEILLEGTAEAQAAFQNRDSLTLSGSLEYQACDDKLCYNPVTVPVAWTLGIKPLVRERPTIR
jgi:DsbC/DsbD-like thiol-disulfide interchange protein